MKVPLAQGASALIAACKGPEPKSLSLAAPPAPEPTATPLDASMSAHELALANLQALLADWLRHEPGARLGQDPEALHDLRVTARRMDATLSLFAPYLPEALVRARGTLKTLLRILGTPRDLDIQLGELTRISPQLSEGERPALQPLMDHLESERARARARMLQALDSESTRGWIDTVRALVEEPSGAPSASSLGAAAVMPELISDRFRKLRKAFRRLNALSSMEEYHAVRARAKKLRYTIEPAAVIYGKPAGEMLRALRRLQDRLGTQQDAYVAKNRLLAIAADPPTGLPSQTLFLMGRLAERHSLAAAEARKPVEKTWRKVRGRRWKALRLQLEELHASSPVAQPVPLRVADVSLAARPERPSQPVNA